MHVSMYAACRRVNQEDAAKGEEKFQKSKLVGASVLLSVQFSFSSASLPSLCRVLLCPQVHSIMRHVADITNVSLEVRGLQQRPTTANEGIAAYM